LRARSFGLYPPKGLREFSDVVWKRDSLSHEPALERKVGEHFHPARDATGETGPQPQDMRAATLEQDSQTYTTSRGEVEQGRASAVPANVALGGGDEGAGAGDEGHAPHRDEAAVVVANEGGEGERGSG
jgi:hypothetical protein